jgi:hypothetical protein
MGLFKPDDQFPPVEHRERLAKHLRGRKVFENRQQEVYERAVELLKDTPHAAQLQKLHIAVALADILVTKPADLLVGEPPIYESGKGDDSEEQKRLNRIVEENDLNQLIHENTVGNGYRGDGFLKVRFDYKQDFSGLAELGVGIPEGAEMLPIIESVNPSYVFPRLSQGRAKDFKEISIAWVEWVETAKTEVPYLNVERHFPGFILYERYLLKQREGSVDVRYGVPITYYYIEEKVQTGRDNDLVETGVPHLLVRHIPYKSTDETWEGISGIEKIEGLLSAIADRVTQVDYILWKHADPTAYGPPIDEGDERLRMGGKYIGVLKEDVIPGYMTWNAQLDAAFKELDYLVGLVFQISETPQWLFGTTLADNGGGTGTSHTDSGAIKARFMPILSKVKRIRTHVDKAVRDALWLAMEVENRQMDGVAGFKKYTPVYPKIQWKDGIPRDEKEFAEIMQIRTGGKPTIDVLGAVKMLEEVDDDKAKEIIGRIDDDEIKATGTVDSSIFNAETSEADQ